MGTKTLSLQQATILKPGKIPEKILKRSVIAPLRVKRDEVILGSGVGEDCGAVLCEPDEVLVMSTDPITGTAIDIGHLAVDITANDIASAGAEPIGILLTVLLPEESNEAELKTIMSDVNASCEKLNLSVIGGHTEVTDVVNRPVLSVTGVGKVKRDAMITTSGAKPGMDLVVTKYEGLEGTAIIASEKKEELLQKFPEDFIDNAIHFNTMLSVVKDGLIAAGAGAAAMHDVTEGGIFGALWEMGEASGVGLSVDIEKIPLRQETVEICDYFKIDPYCLISSGSMLIAAPNGSKVVTALEQEGIHAAVIGSCDDTNQRVVHYDGQTRYLKPPAADEFHKVLG
ncbi:MAG: hydrogenase maturation factor [bacterium LCO1.1]|uniref:Hydrogenase maturation factor n=1 Tax=Candidatus Weimeria bifida TaxID=2599074 RepID=A0A6N7IY35_9FIRM|nr:hydrogenase maturation factor [Candidatus Weimeria bifida]